MKIVLENIGALKGRVEIEPGALTIFAGGNNTGKTYAMYVLWALLAYRVTPAFSFGDELLGRVKAEGSVQIPLVVFYRDYWQRAEKDIAEALRQHLPRLFGAAQKFFADAKIEVSLDQSGLDHLAQSTPDFARIVEFGNQGAKLDLRFTLSESGVAIAITAVGTKEIPDQLLLDAISSTVTALILDSQGRRAFLLPAERGALNLFYKNIWRGLASQRARMVIRYTEPLDVYMHFLDDARDAVKSTGEMHDQAQALQSDIAKVRYQVSEEGDITATPDQQNGQELGIHLTSSTVKSLFGLWAWLTSEAAPGDYLMIDEPELNLHPDNQRLIARLLVRLANRGIRVVMSTHSDYIVREINNMIMLGSDFPERAEMERQFGYDPSGLERLRAADVAAYHFADQGATPCAISPEFGIEVKSMDDVINSLNKSNNAIYYALIDACHPMVEADENQVNES